MSFGPGKLDEDLKKIMIERNSNAGYILLIGDDVKSTGSSCVGNLNQMLNMPSILRLVADEIERDLMRTGLNRN